MFPLLQTQVPTTLIMLVFAALAFWFIIIRPARKQMAAQREKQEEIKAGAQPGARVMLASGLIGTVRHVGERQIILELAPGTEVTVSKAAIAQIMTPDDEDFEYDDEIVVDEVGDVEAENMHPDTMHPDAQTDGPLAADDEVFAPVIGHDQAEPTTPAPQQSGPIGTEPEGRS